MTKEELIRQEEEFFTIRDHILDEANKRGVTLRILGAVGFRTHCPRFKHIEYDLGRELSDIDFAGYLREIVEIEKIFLDLGYEENLNVKFLFGTERRIYYHLKKELHVDVLLDRLKFCHTINLNGRLNIDYPTIPLVDLLLEKLQIIQINEKDLIDTMILIREHHVGNSDKETINTDYLSNLCSNDWGLWRTVSMNLGKVKDFVQKCLQNQEDATDVLIKIEKLIKKINTKKRSFRWKARSWLGEKKKWYKEVEDVARVGYRCG